MENTNTAAAYTPGPWRARKYPTISGGFTFEIQAGRTILVGCTSSSSHIASVDEANARLMAAAPDLLAALRVIANCVADEQGGVTLGSYEQEIVRAAIAKATGGAA